MHKRMHMGMHMGTCTGMRACAHARAYPCDMSLNSHVHVPTCTHHVHVHVHAHVPTDALQTCARARATHMLPACACARRGLSPRASSVVSSPAGYKVRHTVTNGRQWCGLMAPRQPPRASLEPRWLPQGDGRGRTAQSLRRLATRWGRQAVALLETTLTRLIRSQKPWRRKSGLLANRCAMATACRPQKRGSEAP